MPKNVVKVRNIILFGLLDSYRGTDHRYINTKYATCADVKTSEAKHRDYESDK